MKTSAVVFAALLGTSVATPLNKRQDIDFAAYDATDFAPAIAAPVGIVPTSTVTYDPTAAATSAAALASSDAATVTGTVAEREFDSRTVEKRTACTNNPYNAATKYQVNKPTYSDTSEAFLAFQPFKDAANSAPTPHGYQPVSGFRNLQAAASNPSYMTYTTTGISSYDPQVCADKCSAMTGCISFNIFFERDPNIALDDNACPYADHSVTLIKCSFFGSDLAASDATNSGQYTGASPSFHIVIAGSNAYVGTPGKVKCYNGPTSLGNAIIQVPSGDTSYMGIQTFSTNTPFDPSLCAAACNAKSNYNVQHPPADGSAPRICRFFDAYIMYKNGQNGVFSCMFYTTAWASSYATNTGQYNGQGDHYAPSHSYSYSLTKDSCPNA